MIEQLSLDLKKSTEKKKRFREKLRISYDPWLIIAIVVVLMIAIISYVVIHRKMKQSKVFVPAKTEQIQRFV